MEQKLEQLKTQIPGCFSMDEQEFAGHTCEIEQARNVFVHALKMGIGYKTYLGLFEEYLKGQGKSKGFINEQMKRVKSLEPYFTED